ncbi:MAG: Smr/MutS family protein [Candidatus Limnocylindrales bacterium]
MADDERRRARRERDEHIRAARSEADQVVEDLRAELAQTRQLLERETITAGALDAALARAEGIAGRLPATEPESAPVPLVPHDWVVGERARSRSGGWEGRIAAMERGGRRATLESGGMRINVELADLEPALGVPEGAGVGRRADAGATSNAAVIRVERARSVASSLDLRGARVEEALEALDRYLDDASLAGIGSVTVIHGLGTGALRDAVRRAAADHPLVKSVRAGERGEGGDGATIVSL